MRDTPSKMKRRKSGPPKTTNVPSAQELLENYQRSKRQLEAMPSEEELKKARARFTSSIAGAKTEWEAMERKKEVEKPKATRSGLKRGLNKQRLEIGSSGKFISKGMSEAHETYDEDEREYLKKEIRAKVKRVNQLDFFQLKFLIRYEIFDDLTKIKNGMLKSEFHDLYHDPKVTKEDLRAEIRTSLFKNDQRDYICGFLQGIFEANVKDERGNIKHDFIDYVTIVMVYETVVRIVKWIHQFETFKETTDYMKKMSREALGISDDENE